MSFHRACCCQPEPTGPLLMRKCTCNGQYEAAVRRLPAAFVPSFTVGNVYVVPELTGGSGCYQLTDEPATPDIPAVPFSIPDTGATECPANADLNPPGFTCCLPCELLEDNILGCARTENPFGGPSPVLGIAVAQVTMSSTVTIVSSGGSWSASAGGTASYLMVWRPVESGLGYGLRLEFAQPVLDRPVYDWPAANVTVTGDDPPIPCDQGTPVLRALSGGLEMELRYSCGPYEYGGEVIHGGEAFTQPGGDCADFPSMACRWRCVDDDAPPQNWPTTASEVTFGASEFTVWEAPPPGLGNPPISCPDNRPFSVPMVGAVNAPGPSWPDCVTGVSSREDNTGLFTGSMTASCSALSITPL